VTSTPVLPEASPSPGTDDPSAVKRKRSAVEQLLALASRTEDAALRDLLLRQAANLREVALRRPSKLRKA